MRLTFSRPKRPHTIYVQRSFRDKNGKSTSEKIERLGTEEEIEEKYGCPDGLEWAKAYVARLNREEREGKKAVRVDLSPAERIKPGEQVSYDCGDMLLMPLYNRLGLPRVCEGIVSGTKAKYDLNAILETLVILRLLCPCSKLSSYMLGKKRMRKTNYELEDVYRALSLLSSHIDDIQAAVWENSRKIIDRNTRVVYYDCTNYYFEIEDNDPYGVDPRHPNRPEGIRRRGKSKEHRPNPLVQMGLLMDADGIPLSFIIFPGNESEQPSLQKIEEMIADRFKKPFRQIRNSLRKLKDHVFHFLKDPQVPSHNNASERGIRILKVKQKRSGGFRSQTGAEDFMAIHSVADTAKKNDFSRWDAVLALV